MYRCPLWVPRRPNGLTRILHTFSFGISVFPAVLWNLKWRSSWLLLVVPTMMAGPAALLGALFGRSNTWLHIQDFELDAAEALGILPRFGPLQRLLSAGERQIIRRFDTVSTICDSMVARLAEKGRDKKRTLILRNWVDTNEIRPLAEVSPLRRWLGIPDESVVVLYAGNMGKKQGLDLLLDCAGLLAGEKSLVFLLFGDGVERERLAQRAAGMGNVRMYPFEEPAHLNELLNAADIHVLPQRKDAEGAVLPSKLGGILASGRPVIATASAASDVGRIVSKTGLLVAPGDVEALAQGIQRLANDANLRRALGAAGREYAVDNLNKEVILGKMADLLESH